MDQSKPTCSVSEKKRINIPQIVASLSFILLPIPLFFDFSIFKIHFNNLLLNARYDHLGFPVPVGFIFFCLFLILSIKSVAKVFCFKKTYIDFVVGGLLLLYVFFCFISGYSLLGMLQLCCFPLMIWYVSFLKNTNKYIKIYIISALIFSLLHLLSILVASDWNIISKWDRMLWEQFFHYELYQGLVSYVNVLGLLSVLALRQVIVSASLKKTFFYAFGFLMFLYLAALSSQRAFVLDLVLISLFILFIVIFYKKTTKAKKAILLLALLAIWLLSALVVGNSLGSPVKRLYTTFQNIIYKTYDGDSARFFSQRKAVLEITEIDVLDDNVSLFNTSTVNHIYRGTGIVHTGSHNFILDQLLGVGLLGSLCYFTLVLLLFGRLMKTMFSTRNVLTLGFLGLLACMCGAACMVNSPLTQPLYFCNLLAVALCILPEATGD